MTTTIQSQAFKLVLDFDVNGTIILQDKAKQASWDEMLLSAIAENTIDQWDSQSKPMNFKEYICQIVLPGDKSDQVLKQKRQLEVKNFIQWLENNAHPALKRVKEQLGKIREQFMSSEEPKSLVFPSFYRLLEKLRQHHIDFVIKLRTFGNDLKEVTEEISHHPYGVKFEYEGKFTQKKLLIKDSTGKETLVEKVDEIFEKFIHSQKHFAIQDDWKDWNADKERARSGKPFIFDSLGFKRQVAVLNLGFDDNFNEGAEFDIFNPLDISQAMSGKEANNRFLFKVNTLQAMQDPDYFINLVKKSLLLNNIETNLY